MSISHRADDRAATADLVADARSLEPSLSAMRSRSAKARFEETDIVEPESRAAEALLRAPLPAPVARFVEIAAEAHSGPFRTVELETTAWMRRPGMPPIPLEIDMVHRLGEGFVHDIRIGRRPLAVRVGLDAFVDGQGVVRIGRSVKRGSTYDRGALIAMWGEALVFPPAWLDRADVRWEAIDAVVARLVVPCDDGHVPITVSFDPLTGLPDLCLADRHKGDGSLTPWAGIWRDWQVADGVLAPRRLVVRWLDEPDPWLAITVRSIHIGAPVDAAFERVRRIIAAPGFGNESERSRQVEGRSR